LEIVNGEYHLKGFIGEPAFTRPNRTGQYLFINNRPVYSPLFSKCVREGYGTTLSPNRHPVFVLHLGVPGDSVDVNVHPQKREVRLRNEYLLRQMIIQGIEASLQAIGANLFDPNPLPSCDFTQQSLAQVPDFADIFLPQKPNYFDMKVEEEKIEPSPAPTPKKTEPAPVPDFVQTIQEARIRPRVLATLPGYILLDASSLPSESRDAHEGLCLVDQKAAHSRILYEQLIRSLEKGQPIDLQALLIPDTFEASAAEAALFRENLPLFNSLGIQIREFGRNTFAIEALAVMYEKMNLKDFLSELLRQIEDPSIQASLEHEKQKQIAKAAARTAISRTKKMEVIEAQSFVVQLFQCESPWKCPHGQPTLVNIGQAQLASLFNLRGRS